MRPQNKKRAIHPKDDRPETVGRSWCWTAIGLSLIVLTTWAIYSPARYGGRLIDDDVNITRPELRSLSGLYRIWFEAGATQQYYPLVHTAFWIEHKLWGDSVLGYHLINVFWHSLAVLLAYLILNRLKIPGALLAAAVFAVHPVMVESVAWISEQKNTLSTVLYLSAMLVFVKFHQSRKRWDYFVALVFFAMALMAKTITLTLPAALLVIFWWQRGTLSWKSDIRPLIPFFLLAFVAGAVTIWVEKTFVGASGPDFELSYLQRFLLAGRAVWFYLGKLFWPGDLMFFYPRWEIDPANKSQWLFPFATIGVTLALWMLRYRTRAPLSAWLYFCGTLLPVLGFFNVYWFLYSFVADHFQYLASLGIIALAASAIVVGLERMTEPARWVGTAISTILVLALAVLSARQSRMYSDIIALDNATLASNPACWVAHNNLGLALMERNQQDEAMYHYGLALEIKHDNFEAHTNIGNALVAAGQLPEAINEFQAALAIKPDDPIALNSQGTALVQLGRHSDGIAKLERALQLKPDYAEAHDSLGIALATSGDMPRAIEQFQRALEIDEYNAKTQNNLATALMRTGKVDEAITYYEQAVRLQPDFAEAHSFLADALRQVSRPQQAIERYQTALRLKPNFIQAYANMAQVLAGLDRSKEAVAAAEKGIDVARSTGQEAQAEQIEEWLKHYQTELRRSGDESP